MSKQKLVNLSDSLKANRLKNALRNIKNEDDLGKVSFFLGLKYHNWKFKGGDANEQQELLKFYEEQNIVEGLTPAEEHELFNSLKECYARMLMERERLVSEAFDRLYANEIRYVEANAKETVLDEPTKSRSEQEIYESVKDMPYNDRIRLMIADPIKTLHGHVNMSATARAYGIIYKDALHYF